MEVWADVVAHWREWKPYYTETNWKPSSIPYFAWTLFFITGVYLFETYLDYRQHRKLYIKEFPAKLEEAIQRVEEKEEKTQEEKDKHALLTKIKAKFDKSREYGLDKSSFGFLSDAYGQLETTVFLVLGYLPYMWVLSGELLVYGGYDGSNEILRAIVFITITSVRDMLVSLPFELYSTFIIEERHGFNKQTLGIFFMDKLKSLFVSAVIGYPVMALLIYLIQWGGEYFYLYVWGFLLVFSIIMMTIVPVFIMPLFNKFTPLEDGSLRQKIEDLASKLHFPLTKLFVCDGSKRSSHSNAYFYGLFKSKRIVLFDTLVEQMQEEEIVAVLGHELGHWKMWHTAQGFIIQQLYMFSAFFVFGRCMNDPDLYASFGFETSTLPVFIGLLLFFQTLWAPVDKVLSFLVTLNTRRNEFQADAFSVHLGYGDVLQSALTKLSIENLSNMNPDDLYSAYHYSHPPLLERLNAITDEMKKAQ